MTKHLWEIENDYYWGTSDWGGYEDDPDGVMRNGVRLHLSWKNFMSKRGKWGSNVIACWKAKAIDEEIAESYELKERHIGKFLLVLGVAMMDCGECEEYLIIFKPEDEPEIRTYLEKQRDRILSLWQGL